MQCLVHFLEPWYKPETIEELKKKTFVEEKPEKNEITFHTGQWRCGTRLGRIYRKESITVVPSDSEYVPKSVRIVYGFFLEKGVKELAERLLNSFVKRMNKAIDYDVVELARPYENTVGFEVKGENLKTDEWEKLICYVFNLDKKIYGPDFDIELYETPKQKQNQDKSFTTHPLSRTTSRNSSI
jgi:hypothetical protein